LSLELLLLATIGMDSSIEGSPVKILSTKKPPRMWLVSLMRFFGHVGSLDYSDHGIVVTFSQGNMYLA
jgi:hypothetical protein